MKKQLIMRGLMGFPMGVIIGYAITIIISLAIADGHYYPVTPSLSQALGSEMLAVILQAVLCGLMGSAFSMMSIIWQTDSWSLAKQSGIYFGLACVVMLPAAYLLNWMEHSLKGFLIYFFIFVMIFAFTWISQYIAWKVKIKKMNEKLDSDK